MNRKILIGLMVLAATALALFNQNLAYLLHDHILTVVAPVYYVTIFTIVSVALYVMTLYIIYSSHNRGQLDKNGFLVIFPITMTISVVASAWSLFVLAMWWG
ncbi:hypothetical protein QR721_12405 [Aciduricibacillus chroicocephali]|uniref:Uncharacterized protein n=1 Tax=Aciduricibacillus chroicocephali TaxID=3054939 RepID=A0ABY9KXK0_9BACI|nr:hypothetical protein QR721_12405 [Bacillaceae bacterium 44XB]